MLQENIKKLRKKNNMSQEELAEKLGVSRQSVSLWETGQTQPTIDNIIALAKIFNTSTDEILGNTSAETPKQEDLPDKKKTPIWPFIALMIAAAALIVAIILIVHSCRGTGYGPNREETGTALPTDATHDSGRTSISDTTPPDTTQAPQTSDMTSYVSTEETELTEPVTTEPPVTEPATTEPITTAPVTTKPKETTKPKKKNTKTVYVKVDKPVSGRKYCIINFTNYGQSNAILAMRDSGGISGSWSGGQDYSRYVTVYPGIDTTDFAPFVEKVTDDCIWTYNKGYLKNVKYGKYLANGTVSNNPTVMVGVSDNGTIVGEGGTLTFRLTWSFTTQVYYHDYAFFFEAKEIEY